VSHRIAIELDAVLANVSTERANHEPTGDVWARLDEREPQTVARLAELAAARQWEILFLTKSDAGGYTAQADAQRWLESKGFALPSVYVAPGPRGPIAAALNLDIVIAGSPENCADVVAQSTARAILVWRSEQSVLPDDASQRFDIVKSVGECLNRLAADDRSPHETGWFLWVRRLLGSKEAKA
jgi:hypothetical protein